MGQKNHQKLIGQIACYTKGKRPYVKQDEEQVLTPKAVLCPLHVCDGTHISVFILSNACVTHTHTQNTKFKKMIYRLILHNFKV